MFSFKQNANEKNADESSIKVGVRKGANTATFPVYSVSRKDISVLNLKCHNHAVRQNKVFIYLLLCCVFGTHQSTSIHNDL